VSPARGVGAVDHVTLFGHWICPSSVRVSFALAERGITHDLVDVPPTAARPPGYVVPPEFVEHSPRGEIPLVRIGSEYRADSLPILEWLEERIDGRSLLPSDPGERTRVFDAMAWIDARVFPPMIGVYYGTHAERIAASAADLADALVALGDRLGDGRWLVGEGPTLAEATVEPLYVRLDGLVRLGFDRPLDPRVAAHRARVAQLDGGRAVAWSTAQTDEFVGRCEAFRARRRASEGMPSGG
jgi:glutathione S-transferase